MVLGSCLMCLTGYYVEVKRYVVLKNLVYDKNVIHPLMFDVYMFDCIARYLFDDSKMLVGFSGRKYKNSNSMAPSRRTIYEAVS
jgi:hypothetical protein